MALFSVSKDPSLLILYSGGTQVETINSEIPPTYMVPNTPVNTIISITGENGGHILGLSFIYLMY